MFCLLHSKVEPIVGSERPGVFEELLEAVVLAPTSVVRPKVVSRLNLLGISATIARQRKCLFLDSFLTRGPLATSWSSMGICGFLCFYTSPSFWMDFGISMHRLL